MTIFENAMSYMTGESIDEFPEIEPTYESAMRILREADIEIVTEVKNDEEHGFYYYDTDTVSKIKNVFRKMLDWFKKSIQDFNERISKATKFVEKNEKLINENMNKIPKGFTMKIHPALIDNKIDKALIDAEMIVKDFEARKISFKSAKLMLYSITSVDTTRVSTSLTNHHVTLAKKICDKEWKKYIHLMKNGMTSSERHRNDLGREFNNINIPENDENRNVFLYQHAQLSYIYHSFAYRIYKGAFNSAFSILKAVAKGFK